MADARAGRRRVLVADGIPELRDVLRDLLQEEGYAVAATGDVASAAAALAADRPDLLVVDLGLGQADAWAALAALRRRAHERGVPVVATATLRSFIDGGRAAGAWWPGDPVLAKPFDLDAFLAVVRDRVGGA